MIMPEVTGGVLDFDDTLLNNKNRSPEGSLHDRSVVLAIQEVGIQHEYDELAAVTVKMAHTSFLAATQLTAESGLHAMFDDLAIKGLGPNLRDDLIRKIIVLKDLKHESLLMSEGEPHEGAVEFVRAVVGAYGIPLSIASMAARTEVAIFNGKFGLDPYFDDSRIITRQLITRPKPHKQAYNLGYLSLGTHAPRRSTFAIDDDPKGIASAKAAGLFTIGYTSRLDRKELSSRDVRPDVIVDSYPELAELFGITLEPTK